MNSSVFFEFHSHHNHCSTHVVSSSFWVPHHPTHMVKAISIVGDSTISISRHYHNGDDWAPSFCSPSYWGISSSKLSPSWSRSPSSLSSSPCSLPWSQVQRNCHPPQLNHHHPDYHHPHAASRVHNSTCCSSPFCSHSKLLSFVEVLKYTQFSKVHNDTIWHHAGSQRKHQRRFLLLFKEAAQQQQITTRRKKTKLWGEKLTSFVIWPRFRDLMPFNLS